MSNAQLFSFDFLTGPDYIETYKAFHTGLLYYLFKFGTSESVWSG